MSSCRSWGSGSADPDHVPRVTVLQSSSHPRELCAHGGSCDPHPCLPGIRRWSPTECPDSIPSPLQPSSGVTVEGVWTLRTDRLVSLSQCLRRPPVWLGWVKTLRDLERQFPSLCNGIAVSPWAQGSYTETPGPRSRGQRLTPGTWDPGWVRVGSRARGERAVRE